MLGIDGALIQSLDSSSVTFLRSEQKAQPPQAHKVAKAFTTGQLTQPDSHLASPERHKWNSRTIQF